MTHDPRAPRRKVAENLSARDQSELDRANYVEFGHSEDFAQVSTASPSVATPEAKGEQLMEHIPCMTCGEGGYACKCNSAPSVATACLDCGHPKEDFRFHHDAPGTNWGAALHWYRGGVATEGQPELGSTANPLLESYTDFIALSTPAEAAQSREAEIADDIAKLIVERLGQIDIAKAENIPLAQIAWVRKQLEPLLAELSHVRATNREMNRRNQELKKAFITENDRPFHRYFHGMMQLWGQQYDKLIETEARARVAETLVKDLETQLDSAHEQLAGEDI